MYDGYDIDFGLILDGSWDNFKHILVLIWLQWSSEMKIREGTGVNCFRQQGK